MKVFWSIYIAWCAVVLAYDAANGILWATALQAFFIGYALTMVLRDWLEAR